MTVTPTVETVLADFNEMLSAETEGYLRLPAIDLSRVSEITNAVAEFTTHNVEAGQEAARWLKESALAEHLTARTVLLLGRGQVLGFYSLAATSVRLTLDERETARIVADRTATPATLLTWIARNPKSVTDGTAMVFHAMASSRRAAELSASAVFVLDAFDDATATFWLSRELLALRRLENGKKNRLWTPLA